ncbi:MAG: hypothetical protein P1U64_07735 [Alcanivoracaceae bacterium]|nr:hypothetical protein [Alcanivoracaceae bacterium]
MDWDTIFGLMIIVITFCYMYATYRDRQEVFIREGMVKVPEEIFRKWLCQGCFESLRRIDWVGRSHRFYLSVESEPRIGVFWRSSVVWYSKYGKHSTILAHDLSSSVPEFMLRPRGVLDRTLEERAPVVECDDAEFADRYVLSSNEPDRVRALFSNLVIYHLLKTESRHIEVRSGKVLTFRDSVSAERGVRLAELLAELRTVVALFDSEGKLPSVALSTILDREDGGKIRRYIAEIKIEADRVWLRIDVDGAPVFDGGFSSIGDTRSYLEKNTPLRFNDFSRQAELAPV